MSGRSNWLVYQINKNGMCGKHWMIKNFDGTCDGCKYELEKEKQEIIIQENKENENE